MKACNKKYDVQFEISLLTYEALCNIYEVSGIRVSMMKTFPTIHSPSLSWYSHNK